MLYKEKQPPLYESSIELFASEFTAIAMSGYMHGPRGRFGKVSVKQNERIEPWDQEAQVSAQRTYMGNGAEGWKKPGVRFQSPPRTSANKAETGSEHVCRPMVVVKDATGRIVSSYIPPNLDDESVVRKGGMVIEACGENCDEGDMYGGNGRYLIPASKLNSSARAEAMREQGWNWSGRTNTTNEYNRMGVGGLFGRQQPDFNGTNGWGKPSDTTGWGRPSDTTGWGSQTYNDGYRGKTDGGWGSGATATDEWGRGSNMYSSTHAIDSREVARRYNGKLY